MTGIAKTTAIFLVIAGVLAGASFLGRDLLHLACVGPVLPAWGCLSAPYPDTLPATQPAAFWVQAGAGAPATFSDKAYADAGAKIAADRGELLGGADVVLEVQAPTEAEVKLLPEGSVLISFLQPATQAKIVKALARRKVTAFGLEMLPRISRAQSMDALSSQASLAGYKAVLMAAARLGKFFPMLMTAAGTVAPARVLVLGAGVAGLQAIATARRLGAVVEAYDVRPAVKEEVQSLGAKFVELDLQAQEGAGGYAREQ